MRSAYIDHLTEAIISIEYERIHPNTSLAGTAEDILKRKDYALGLYRNDAMFHARIQHIVSYLVGLTERYCNYKKL